MSYWEIILQIGSLAGLLSIIYLIVKDINKYFIKPKLKILFDYKKSTRTFRFPDDTIRKFLTLEIKNQRNVTAKRAVAVYKIIKSKKVNHIEEEAALHWAGIAYSLQTTGAEPVNIGKEPIRLDIAFTQQNQKISGSWLSIPFALISPLTKNQAYLPVGKYIIKIEVSCENGQGDAKYFKIISPEKWSDLDIKLIKRPKNKKLK